MNQTAFARLEKECVRAVSGNATAGMQANGPPDKELSKLGTRAARSLWPPGASEGANFKAAAAKLKQHMST